MFDFPRLRLFPAFPTLPKTSKATLASRDRDRGVMGRASGKSENPKLEAGERTLISGGRNLVTRRGGRTNFRNRVNDTRDFDRFCFPSLSILRVYRKPARSAVEQGSASNDPRFPSCSEGKVLGGSRSVNVKGKRTL